jgi:hypothetical protein
MPRILKLEDLSEAELKLVKDAKENGGVVQLDKIGDSKQVIAICNRLMKPGWIVGPSDGQYRLTSDALAAFNRPKGEKV